MSARAFRVEMYHDGVYVADLKTSSIHITHNDSNRYGWCTLTIPNPKGKDYYAIDNLVVITRYPGYQYPLTLPGAMTIPGNYPPGRIEFVGMIRKRGGGTDAEGIRYAQIGCPDLKYILTSMDIDAQVGSAAAKKTDYLDDMLKEIIADQDGNLPSDFSIMTDVSLADSTTLEFAKENVYDIAQDICNISAEKGTELYFDVAYISPSSFQFRTAIDQPGVDTTSKILFSDMMNNINVPYWEEDYTEEITQVTAWGSGNPGNQDYSTQTDTGREARSRWNHREYSFNAGHVATTALAEMARRELFANRPRSLFTCELLDNSPNAIYGVHWHHGDRVKVGYEGMEYSGIVRNVEINWNWNRNARPDLEGLFGGEEQFSARFEFTDSVAGGGVIA